MPAEKEKFLIFFEETVMQVSKYRLKRMIRIVDMMRKGLYPNYTTISKAFEKATFDTSETMILTCDRKTIWRDMKILKEEFNCPWKYDRSRHGFYLTDPHWDFAYPAYLSETQMMALLMGRRISENIFPEPLKGEICNAVDYLLNVANPDLAKCSFVSQMKLFSAQTGKVNEEIFDRVYRTWRDHICLKIIYRDYQGKVSTREIEPHALFFQNNNWFVHARANNADTPRSFMIHRIQNAEILKKTFVPDPEIYENIHFTLTPVKNVVLKFRKDIHDSIFAMPFHEQQEIVWETDDPVFKLVRIPEAPMEILVQRILSYAGKLVVVEPQILKDKVREAAASVLETHQP